ncbi:hypothetical protein AAOGI_30650 [Agarivorans albus]
MRRVGRAPPLQNCLLIAYSFVKANLGVITGFYTYVDKALTQLDLFKESNKLLYD